VEIFESAFETWRRQPDERFDLVVAATDLALARSGNSQ
jgi:hypothetical protein